MTLTETRKPDRAKMAKLLVAAVLGAGAVKAEIKPESGDPTDYYDGRRTTVSIEAERGLHLGVDFNGRTPQSQPDIHVLSWHIRSTDSDARLADVFGYDAVNPHHFLKATQVAHGFEQLCEMVVRGVTMARDGSAFSPEREAAMIAKHGTAAERSAQWAQWRAEEQNASQGATA